MSSSLTKDQTRAPCTGSVESLQLDWPPAKSLRDIDFIGSFFFFLIIYLFIFDCAESSLLCVGFLQLQRVRATLCLWFMDSLWWLLPCVAPEHMGFSTCGAQVQLLSSLWDLPGPGVELVSPAFQGAFLTTWPPGKHPYWHFLNFIHQWVLRFEFSWLRW